MKKAILFLAVAVASASAQAAQFLCTEKGKARPTYITVTPAQVSLVRPPSFVQRVLLRSQEPVEMPKGYVASYETVNALCGGGPSIHGTCKSLQVTYLFVSQEIANAEMQGNILYDGKLLKCSQGTF